MYFIETEVPIKVYKSESEIVFYRIFHEFKSTLHYKPTYPA